LAPEGGTMNQLIKEVYRGLIEKQGFSPLRAEATLARIVNEKKPDVPQANNGWSNFERTLQLSQNKKPEARIYGFYVPGRN
jgi:hypothetical protein